MNEMRSKLFYELEKLDDCIDRFEQLNKQKELTLLELENINKRINHLQGLVFCAEELKHELKHIS